MSDRTHFHFTIAPVQAFVAQARRTRDFWAGSFLLSVLAGVAMREVQAQKGEVLFPKPDPEFLRALSGEPVDRLPQQGLIPNRFKAEVPAAFDPQAVCRAVRLAWVEISRLAWERLPRDLRDSHEGLRRVWSRQIGVDLDSGTPTTPDPFWQLNWALGSDADGEDLLDRRKHLRTTMPPAEPGAKCMLMEGWQELSGAERPNAETLDTFWMRVGPHVNQRNKADLAPGEQLCALALVKRLFPNEFHRLEPVPMPGGWRFTGWKLQTGVPSVAYLAAAPWLAQTLTAIDPATAKRFVEASEPLGASTERRTHLRMIDDAVQGRDELQDFAHLDGSLFFASSLARDFEPDPNVDSDVDPGAVRRSILLLQRLLDQICRQPARKPSDSRAELGAPLPHFAVLAMDGDNLGRNMAHVELQPVITEALARFASAVPDIVARHSGFLVYAGGDDVRALMPVPSALPCARELRSHYQQCFNGTAVASTLSGAVLFANHKLPLGHVLQEAHDLLDDVAKEGRGRDAIAVQVSNRGSDLVRWAQPWTIALGGGTELVLESLAGQMASGDAPFSHRFFHRIDALIRLVNPNPERGSDPLDHETAVDLFTAELLDSSRYRDRPKTTGEAAEEEVAERSVAEKQAAQLARAKSQVEALLGQCRPVIRRIAAGTGEVIPKPQPRIEADGAFLVRFLERHHHGSDGP